MLERLKGRGVCMLAVEKCQVPERYFGIPGKHG